MCRRLAPDVVLMDIRMPELDGIEATRRLVEASSDDNPVRVLMLTTFDLNEYVYEALRAGASGFLLKDVPPEQLAAGIRVVADGEALLAPSITKRLIQEFAEVAPAMPEPPRGMDELTARELEVFKLVARGLSNAEIAAELIVSETTVKTHVARMLMKLGLRDRVQAVVLAYEHGVAIPGRRDRPARNVANINGSWVGVGVKCRGGEEAAFLPTRPCSRNLVGRKVPDSDRFFPQHFLTGLEWEESGPRPAGSDRDRRSTTPPSAVPFALASRPCCTSPSPLRASAGKASSSATTRRARASGAAWAGAG